MVLFKWRGHHRFDAMLYPQLYCQKNYRYVSLRGVSEVKSEGTFSRWQSLSFINTIYPLRNYAIALLFGNRLLTTLKKKNSLCFLAYRNNWWKYWKYLCQRTKKIVAVANDYFISLRHKEISKRKRVSQNCIFPLYNIIKISFFKKRKKKRLLSTSQFVFLKKKKEKRKKTEPVLNGQTRTYTSHARRCRGFFNIIWYRDAMFCIDD